MTVTVYTEGATVNVIAKPSGPPLDPTISNFTATPSACFEGDSVVFSAQVANAVSTTLNGAAVTLPHTLVPPRGTQTYTLVATGAAGTTPAQSSVTVVVSAVSPLPPSGLAWYANKASGTISNVGTNTLHPLSPPTQGMGVTGFAGIMAACGGIFAADLGPCGSYIQCGGGHADWYGNDVYAFDLDSQTWSQLRPPDTPLYLDSGQYHGDTHGRLYADPTCTTVHQDKPVSRHNFGHIVYLPPGKGHADPVGAMLLPVFPVITHNGQRGAGYAWIFTLSDKKYAQYSDPADPAIGFDYSHSFADLVRNRVVVHGYGFLYALDLNTKRYTKLPPQMPTSVNYMVWAHIASLDLYVGVRAPAYGHPTFVYVLDPKTNALTKPGIVGTWPFPAGTQQSGGGFWSDILGAFVYHHGYKEKELRLVKPPSSGNPRTTPWEVSVRTFTGDEPAVDDSIVAGAHCKRLVEVPAANGCLWFARTRSPAQWFKY